MGSTRPGDVLAEVDGVAVSDASFDKVRGCSENCCPVLGIIMVCVFCARRSEIQAVYYHLCCVECTLARRRG